VFADPLLDQHIFWHAWWDKSILINMFNPEIDSGNIIAVSEEDLKEEQKQAMEKAIEEYRQLCLKSFSLNKSG
jgi:hypothetical protein